MDQPFRCERCDTPLSGQAVSGLCANCLLKLALDPPAEAMPMADEPGKEITVESAAPREAVGSRIGRYKLLQEIGEGGFGIVYLADQLEPVKRRVALKVLKPGMDTREVIARFEAERQSLALMDHPNIARIFDGGATESGRPYFVMELVKGIPLTKYCDDRNLNTRQRLDLFLDVLAAVQHAHQKGIIHRDLKPANILVSPHDSRPVIKIIDFGIAKAISLELTDKTLFTAHGRMIGTPQYMSPEQAEINALDVDTRSDLYSLGVILYEVLTGRTPLDAKKLRNAAYAEIQRLIREEEPPKPSTRISTLGDALPDIARQRGAEPEKLGKLVRGDLDWIVMKALEKDRTLRYETANGFATDLRRHLENQPVTARPPSAAYLLSRFVRRHKFGFAAAAAVSVVLLAGIAGTTRGLMWEAAARKTAESEAARAEAETAKAVAANKANTQNLHRASMSDYASAVKLLAKDFESDQKSTRAVGFENKSHWHEGVILLARSLHYNPRNTAAALRLFDTIRYRGTAKRDWPLAAFKYDGSNGSFLNQELARGAVFSPNGTQFVYVSGDNTAQVRQEVTGRPAERPMLHDDLIYNVNYSPDGTQIVTSGFDGTARLWDAATGEPLGEPLRHKDPHTFASLEKKFGRDQVLIQTRQELLRSLNAIVIANFSGDGRRMVTVRGDGEVQLWNPATGEALGQPLLHHDLPTPVFTANFSPDGNRLVTATYKEGSARVWDVATGQLVGAPVRHEAAIRTAQFSPDGSLFLTASHDHTAQIWNTETGQRIGEPMRHEARVNGAIFSPDGTRIVTAGHDNRAIIWEADTGKPVWTLLHDDEVMDARFSSDGSLIVTVCQKSAQVWDARLGLRVGEPMHHDGFVFHARFSPDGTRVVTTLENQNVRLWDAPNEPLFCVPVRHPSKKTRFNSVPCAAISDDGMRIVTVDTSNDVRLWDSGSLRPIGEPVRCNVLLPSRLGTTSGFIEGPPKEGRAVSVCFGTAGIRIAVTALHVEVARVWEAVTSQAVGEPLKHAGEITGASFSKDGVLIATWGRDKAVRIWEAGTGRIVGTPILHDQGVVCVSFSPDRKFIVTGGGTQTAVIWRVETGQPVGKPMHHDDNVVSAEFSPDGGRIVTVTKNDIVRIWDMALGESISRPMHQGGSSSGKARFNPDGTRIVSSNDRSIRIWDAVSGLSIGEPRRHEESLGCRDVSFTPDGTGVLTVGSETVWLWRTVTTEEAEDIAAITPEILTWASHIAGLRFSEDGELTLIPDEERQVELASSRLPSGPWAELARWITAPLPHRALDLNSKFTPRQIAERERDFEGEGTVKSLESALRYDPTVPLARLFLAAALEKADAAREAKDRESGIPQRAAFLRRYDLDALAREAGRMKKEELAALWVRAAHHLAEFPADTKVGVGPKPTTAREEAKKAARKALELVPGLPAAEAVLKKVQALDGTNN